MTAAHEGSAQTSEVPLGIAPGANALKANKKRDREEAFGQLSEVSIEEILQGLK